MRLALILVALLVVGCKREPSFDERFADTEKALREQAARIDAELSEREKAAAATSAQAVQQAAE